MDELAWLLRSGVIRVADHPRLRRTLYRRVAAGQLVVILPGVLVPAAVRHDLLVRARALALWDPDAVLTGAAAAALTYWRDLAVADLTFSSPAKRVVPRGFTATRERLPPELVRRLGPVAVTVPALTALDLVSTLGGAGIDNALRRRAVTLEQLYTALALTPRRWGNRERRRLLHVSRAEPWSEAERRAHTLLWAARISGWRSNVGIRCGEQVYFGDIVFEAERVIIEIDGYDTHSRLEQFHHDRRRWSDLVVAGWTIVHVSWDQLHNDPAWVVRTVRAALVMARSDRNRRSRGRRASGAPVEVDLCQLQVTPVA